MLPKRIVVMGASSVYGEGDPAGGGFVERLRSWHAKAVTYGQVYNLGIPGDTTTGMLARFSEIKIRRPELIIYSLGLNDARRADGRSSAPATLPAVFRKQVNELVWQSKPIAKVAFVSAFPIDESRTAPYANGSYYTLADAKAYTDITADVCAKESVPYLDLFKEWSGLDYQGWLAADGLHCNAAGHQKIFEELQAFLTSLFPG